MKYLGAFLVVTTVFLGVLMLTSDYERLKRESRTSTQGTTWAQLR
jgi:hypothetical protein